MQPAGIVRLRGFALAAATALVTSCACDCQAPPPVPDDRPVPLFTCRDGRGGPRRAAMTKPAPGTDAAVVAAIDADLTAAKAARDAWRDKTFEEYLQSVRRECGPGGKFLVDGDVAIPDIKLLREFFEDDIQGAPAPRAGARWTTQQKHALTYCVSTAFGARHDQVVADMEAATGAWEQVASVDFEHAGAQDDTCDARNGAVIFDVNPVDVDGDYLARAFFPGEPRAGRNVYVDVAALSFDPAQELQLAGVLRHELGHALGFRHEHARPGSGACFEDGATGVDDALSVMRYPPCSGGTSWKWLLNDRDKSGAACVYGPAPGFSIDPAICTARRPPVPPPGAPVAKLFASQVVTRAAVKEYGPFDAKPGSLVRVSMRPRGPRTGDPDLYVRLGRMPVVRPPAFTCRPYLTGALETCEIDAGAAPNNLVRVFVHGYSAGSYDLEVSFVPLAPVELSP